MSERDFTKVSEEQVYDGRIITVGKGVSRSPLRLRSRKRL